MRIVVNMLQTLKPKTGVGRYAAGLFEGLSSILPPRSVHGFPDGRLASLMTRLNRSGGASPGQCRGWRRLAGKVRSLCSEPAKRIARVGLGSMFRSTCRQLNCDVYHEPNFIPFASDLPTVITVHDLSVLLHPQWHPADRVRQHERLFRRAVQSAQHIITDSAAIRRELIDYLNVPPGRVSAIPIGVGREYFDVNEADAERVRIKRDLPKQYLLFVGTLEPRKNVSMLLRAYADLPASLRRQCPLVLAGGWGWKAAEIADQLHRTADVIHLGYMADDELPGLYAGARALAFPSHYEGFGLPPLEMLATNGAVLASTAEVLRETLARHACYVQTTDVAAWRDALKRAITDDDWLDELRRGGRDYARQFTWEKCAAETARCYRRIAGLQRQAA